MFIPENAHGVGKQQRKSFLPILKSRSFQEFAVKKEDVHQFTMKNMYGFMTVEDGLSASGEFYGGNSADENAVYFDRVIIVRKQ